MKQKNETILLIATIIALAILIPFASSNPDGLERVAESLEVEEPAPLWRGIMPDYSLENIDNPYVSTLISGMLGVCLVLAASFIIGKAVSKGESK
ncbi:cobalamin biosynthesis protein CbiN [Candidatus Bathyarchaeota archaeon]|nr:MAG: cobalamin biosynthesis protein CbiN [Candidatus Bathyarchaeota archaeon]